MKKRVLVLLSVYNGGHEIVRQVDSIIQQSGVDISIYIRDDGSGVETVKILQYIEKKYTGRIHCTYGINLGFKQSFMELIYTAGSVFDYYAFSDQDDLWFSDKIISCINLMESGCSENRVTDNRNNGVGYPCKLAHCNCISVDNELNSRAEQENRVPCPPNHKMAISTEFFQGCGMVWNRELMELVCTYRPKNRDISHDFWIGLLGYLFGGIYFCDTPKFYHIRYGNNESPDGDRKKGRMQRLGKFVRGDVVYMNPVQDLLAGYSNYLTNDDITFLISLNEYKSNLKDK